MALARVTPKLGGLPELRTFRCEDCGEVETYEVQVSTGHAVPPIARDMVPKSACVAKRDRGLPRLHGGRRGQRRHLDWNKFSSMTQEQFWLPDRAAVGTTR